MVEAPPFRFGHVAILGRPNVGKSTLLNRLLGQKLVITSTKPQTTRHQVIGIKTRPDAQIVFVDTPGIHSRGDGPLNRYLNRAARSAASGVDAILWVVEALRVGAEDWLALERASSEDCPLFLVVNKVDRVHPKSRLLPFLETLAARHDFAGLFPVSALRGTQLGPLEDTLVARLPEGSKQYPEDQISDRPQRFFAAELLREQLTARYAQELPYCLSVEIEAFEEDPSANLYRIAAVVWVERPGQKAILIGRGGLAMKEAASVARVEMERLFGCRVFLQVWVRVQDSWSGDEAALARLGYQV